MPVRDWIAALDLSTGEKKALEQALNDSGLATNRLELLAEAAFIEYVEWLISRRRFTTVSELDTHRIFRLFNDIRKESPSVESLANEIGLSPGKAVSVITRLRYGEARALAKRASEKAIRSIDAQTTPGPPKKRVAVWLDADEYDSVMTAAVKILKEPTLHNKGGKWEGYERPESRRDKYLGEVTTTLAMWGHIKELLVKEVAEL